MKYWKKNLQELDSADVKANDSTPQWAMVYKQCYEWYQFIKYKGITIRLDPSDRLSNNMIFREFNLLASGSHQLRLEIYLEIPPLVSIMIHFIY